MIDHWVGPYLAGAAWLIMCVLYVVIS